MDDPLLNIVLSRLDQHSLALEPSNLLLAALDGDDELDRELSAEPGTARSRRAAAAPAHDPVGAYLSSITVAGFRGIGPAATLPVKAGPGLTLVVGRNGSGKSSFAEGLEVLLTGELMRLKTAPAVVKEGWRSKHSAGDPAVTAEFYVEGSGRTVVGRSWPVPSGNDLGQSTAWAQAHGQKQQPLQTLGWDSALIGYRPFLSHAELEAFFGRPGELHDLLANVLGLEDLTSAAERLRLAARTREDRLNAAKRDLEQLRPRLTVLDAKDERAQACLQALTGARPASWDIDTVLSVVTGSEGQPGGDGQVARLRHFVNLTAPAADEVTETAAALRVAADRVAELAGGTSEQARNLASLLDAALGHQQAHGDGPCPVCGNPGALTPQWRAATEQHRNRLQDEARSADEAATAAAAAVVRARKLVQGLPQPLSEVTGTDPPAAQLAAQAWRSWAELPDAGTPLPPGDLTVLAEHLETACGPLEAAVKALVQQAHDELARRDDQWSPLAGELALWCDAAAKASCGASQVAPLKAARKWLTDATVELREQRLAPLADQSRAIWADLRQESNVDLGAFRLTGTNTRRQLDLDVTIDGEPGSALGVMSQGEINALALSIFLPRATIDASPFRFLLIDDPVQAMDPAKVDGLAKVLGKVAQQRQVIVFTHDNRLVSAVKDLAIQATIMEVTRRPRSHVEVRECQDASQQALSDARALTKDPNVPTQVAERVVPGLCRTAAEAAFIEGYWRAELRRGRTRAQIEETLNAPGKNLKLRRVAALALFDGAESGNVPGRLSSWDPRWSTAYQALNPGAHQGHYGDLTSLVDETKAFVDQITRRLR